MTEPAITPAVIEKHGLTPDEYARIQTILGRDPNFTGPGIFSVMWSEHCSYKNSKRELRKFPTTGPTEKACGRSLRCRWFFCESPPRKSG